MLYIQYLVLVQWLYLLVVVHPGKHPAKNMDLQHPVGPTSYAYSVLVTN